MLESVELSELLSAGEPVPASVELNELLSVGEPVLASVELS